MVGLAEGAYIDQTDTMGYTPVHQCINSVSYCTMKAVLDGRTILHDVAAYGDLGTLTILSTTSPTCINMDLEDSNDGLDNK